MAGNPPDVLATNFGKPAAPFEKFPRKEMFIMGKEGPGNRVGGCAAPPMKGELRCEAQ
jgi:hypothetical protein